MGKSFSHSEVVMKRKQRVAVVFICLTILGWSCNKNQTSVNSNDENILINITDTGRNISAQYDDSPDGETIDKVIDGSSTTKYLTFNSSAWIQYQAPDIYVVTKYTITSANDFPERDPKNWTLKGSNDASHWTLLDSCTNKDFPQRYQKREFTFSNSTGYIYYRLEMTNHSEDILQLAEWELFGTSYHDGSGTLPSAPSGLGATAVSKSRIDLTWKDNSDNEALFRIQQSKDNIIWSDSLLVGFNVTSYSVTGLQDSTLYYYRVYAENSKGQSTYSNVDSVRTLPLPPDGKYTTTVQSDGTILYESREYSLVFSNKNSAISQAIESKMVGCFFTVYPKEAARFNPNTRKKVFITIDPTYNGVAATSGVKISVSPGWMNSHPYDIDVVTHETMHIVQSYSGDNPGWAVEGLADYARYKYGIYNAAGGWSMPNYSSSQNYTDSYRVTARFFVWMENHIRSTILDELDSTMRAGQYSPDFWTEKTGKTVDTLWSIYGSNPAL